MPDHIGWWDIILKHERKRGMRPSLIVDLGGSEDLLQSVPCLCPCCLASCLSSCACFSLPANIAFHRPVNFPVHVALLPHSHGVCICFSSGKFRCPQSFQFFCTICLASFHCCCKITNLFHKKTFFRILLDELQDRQPNSRSCQLESFQIVCCLTFSD